MTEMRDVPELEVSEELESPSVIPGFRNDLKMMIMFSLQSPRFSPDLNMESARYHQLPPTIERHRYGGAGWLVWERIILGSRTDLYVQSVTMTGHI
ncbi:DDE_3 domain-containing protein [Trichonephila clavipes]|nr:DDE_3 domain-containing protein [Trichonephila clavipes]